MYFLYCAIEATENIFIKATHASLGALCVNLPPNMYTLVGEFHYTSIVHWDCDTPLGNLTVSSPEKN